MHPNTKFHRHCNNITSINSPNTNNHQFSTINHLLYMHVCPPSLDITHVLNLQTANEIRIFLDCINRKFKRFWSFRSLTLFYIEQHRHIIFQIASKLQSTKLVIRADESKLSFERRSKLKFSTCKSVVTCT